MIELMYRLEQAILEERYEDAIVIKKEIEEMSDLYDSFFNESSSFDVSRGNIDV